MKLIMTEVDYSNLVSNDREWFSWEGIAAIRGRCEAIAEAEGLCGIELFMRGQRLFDEALSGKPSYRERQEAFKMKCAVKLENPFITALELIADGHNDARSLANDVLSKYRTTD